MYIFLIRIKVMLKFGISRLIDYLLTKIFTYKHITYAQFRIKHQWKRISHMQSARWQHLSWLKANAFFSLQKK